MPDNMSSEYQYLWPSFILILQQVSHEIHQIFEILQAGLRGAIGRIESYQFDLLKEIESLLCRIIYIDIFFFKF
jgi:hypothetical protein